MPWWPHEGPKRVLELAISASRELPALAIEFDLIDHSSMLLEYQVELRTVEGLEQWLFANPTSRGLPWPLVRDEIYDQCGKPPLLSIICDDHGAGVAMGGNGLLRRTKANNAEKRLTELVKYIGGEKPLSVIGEAMTRSRRQYWVKLDA